MFYEEDAAAEAAVAAAVGGLSDMMVRVTVPSQFFKMLTASKWVLPSSACPFTDKIWKSRDIRPGSEFFGEVASSIKYLESRTGKNK